MEEPWDALQPLNTKDLNRKKHTCMILQVLKDRFRLWRNSILFVSWLIIIKMYCSPGSASLWPTRLYWALIIGRCNRSSCPYWSWRGPFLTLFQCMRSTVLVLWENAFKSSAKCNMRLQQCQWDQVGSSQAFTILSQCQSHLWNQSFAFSLFLCSPLPSSLDRWTYSIQLLLVWKLPWPPGRESINSHYQTELSAVTETRKTINNYSFKVFPKGTAMLLNSAYENDCVLLIWLPAGVYYWETESSR